VAILTEFDANFNKLKAAVADATLTLKSFTTDTDKVNTALSKMTDRFSGAKVIEQATLMAEAIERVGGVSQLTEKELAQIAPTVDEAIAKLEKMGQTVPEDLRTIADEAKGATHELGGISGAVETLATTVVGYFTLDAITRYIGAVIEAADQLQTMAVRAGTTLEEIQRLDQIAGQTSTSVEALTGAMQGLESRIGKGDAGVTAAFKDLGINLQAFERLGTYDKLLQINGALRDMEDPAKRARTQNELFGTSWKELAPAMLADMKAIGEGAHLMADDSIAAMADAKNGWTDYVKDVRAKLGDVVGAAIEAKGWLDKTLGPTGYVKGGVGAQEDQADLLATLKKIPPLTLPVIASFQDVGHSYEDLAAESAKWDEKTRESMRLNKEAADKITAYWEGVGKVIDRVTGTDAIGGAQQWADVKARLDDLGVSLASLSSKELVDFDKALGEALDAMARTGQGSSDLSIQWGALQRDVRAALDQFNNVGPQLDQAMIDAERAATTAAAAEVAYRQALYDAAVAEDQAALAAARKNEELRKTKAAAADAEKSMQSLSYTMSSSYSTGDLNEQAARTGGRIATDSYGNKYVYIPGVNAPPGRAAGGPVSAGSSYLVGEKGPELFTPSANGSISPNGAGTVVNNVFNLVDTESNLARRVSESILRSVTQARRV